MFDYLRLALGLLPLAIYLLVMGLLALKQRPTLLTSGQEALLVGFALSGFALIGPIELFFPTGAYAALGEWVWMLLLLLYGLLVVLFSLQRAPSWTVLRMNGNSLRESIEKVLDQASIEHTWNGNQIEIPQWGVNAIVQESRGFRNTSHLIPCGRQRSLIGWYEFEKHFTASDVFNESDSRDRTEALFRSIGLLSLSIACLLTAAVFIDWDMQRMQRLIARVLGV